MKEAIHTRRPGVVGIALRLVVVAVLSSPHAPRAVAVDIVVNTDTLEITVGGNPWDFHGLATLATPQVVNGKAQFAIAGDLQLNTGDTLTGVGARPASFVVGNNVTISSRSPDRFLGSRHAPWAGRRHGRGRRKRWSRWDRRVGRRRRRHSTSSRWRRVHFEHSADRGPSCATAHSCQETGIGVTQAVLGEKASPELTAPRDSLDSAAAATCQPEVLDKRSRTVASAETAA